MFAGQHPGLCNRDEAYGAVTYCYLLAAFLPQRGDYELRYLVTSSCLGDSATSAATVQKNEENVCQSILAWVLLKTAV